MTARTVTDRTRSLIARFWDERRGIAAVEFALILPLIVFIYFGSVEVSEAISIQRMVGLCAGTVANITTQYPVISASQQMPDILGASSAVLTPYPASNALVRVTYITIDGSGRATVGWSQALNGAALTAGQTVTLPAALNTPNTAVVFGETNYAFNPLYDYINFGTFNLYSSVYMFPRSPNGTIILTQ